MMNQFLIVCSTVLLAITPSFCGALELQSPNGKIKLTFSTNSGTPTYAVAYRGQPLVADSALGFTLHGGKRIQSSVTLVESSSSSHSSKWRPVYGECSEISDHYNELQVDLRSSGDYVGNWTLIFRCYDAGVAFRSILSESGSTEPLEIKTEDTEFCFLKDHLAWCAERAQSEYFKKPISEMGQQIERPLTIHANKDVYVAIAEASLQGYARMKLRRSPDNPLCVLSQLSGSVKSTLPLQTPWRVLMLADNPGQLLENNAILLNLNEPCAIADTSWIKPGKVLREMTLTTAGGKAAIDFAARHNMQYVEFDAGWYGHEYDESSDATTISVDPRRSPGPLDLHDCIRYGAERGIGIIVYVNRRCLERQLDEILPLYQKWGLKGVKYGFVNVGSQKWTAWLHDAIRKAADHQLMVNVHDEYRSMGFARTYPNLITQEGVGGDETSPTNEQTLINVFTRYLAGSADFTPCYFNKRVDENATHAHQLAKPICAYSPWQFLYWYDSPLKIGSRDKNYAFIQETPELEFWDAMPTVWDETKVLHGSIGEYAVVARRSGEAWFLGAMTDDQPRVLATPCDFLKPDTSYVAYIYRDDPSLKTRTQVDIDRFLIDQQTTLNIEMIAKGGQAIRIVPATKQDHFPRYHFEKKHSEKKHSGKN